LSHLLLEQDHDKLKFVGLYNLSVPAAALVVLVAEKKQRQPFGPGMIRKWIYLESRSPEGSPQHSPKLFDWSSRSRLIENTSFVSNGLEFQNSMATPTAGNTGIVQRNWVSCVARNRKPITAICRSCPYASLHWASLFRLWPKLWVWCSPGPSGG